LKADLKEHAFNEVILEDQFGVVIIKGRILCYLTEPLKVTGHKIINGLMSSKY